MDDPLPTLRLCVEAYLMQTPKPTSIAVLDESGRVIGVVTLDWFDAVADKLAKMRAAYIEASGH